MPELNLLDANNNKVGTVQASADVFEVKVRKHLVHQCVNLQLATRRRGTAATKSNYGQLSGSGKKPWKQKGTGRARVGKTRSAIWRGGLTIFGPTPRSYSFKMSKKARKLAIKSVLTEYVSRGSLTVVDQLNLDAPKTREAVKLLDQLELPGRTLFVIAEPNENLQLAVRNLPQTDVLLVDGLNAYDLLLHEKVVCTQESLKKIEERLG